MSSSRLPLFGDVLKRYRVAAGLTQEELAARAGLSPKGISDLERGARQTPRRDTIQLLAEALKLSDRDYAVLEAAARRRAVDGSPSKGSPPVSAGERAPGTIPPLVGRKPERALIEWHLSGEGPAVLAFAGEPGIGKSRLLREAAQRGREQGWCVLQGGCHRRSGQEPYAPFLGLLERHLASLSLTERSAALKGCGWLARLLPELAEEVTEAMPTWTLPPEQERRQMFGAVARYLANVATAAGALLVLDDLQWAGTDALDLFDFVLHAPSPMPMRVVVAYRDIEVRSQDALAILLTDLAREGHVMRSLLHPLPTSEAAALLDELLSGMAGNQAPSREHILQRAGGLPFFLVSCAEVLRDDALKGGPGHLEGPQLPWGVTESIRQRVAVLPELARETLEIAAVIGRVSPRALLVRVAGEPARREEDLLGALEAACQARLLMEEGETTYTFAHDLVREVIGKDLSAARRASLHRRVVAALEQLPGEPPVERLAYHASRAGDIARATLYLERAGDHAWALHANTEAERAYRDLLAHLEQLGRPAEVARVSEKLEQVLETLGQNTEALAVLERALACFRAAGDLEAQRRVLARMARPYHNLNRDQDGIARLLAHLEVSEREAPTPGLVLVQAALAWHYHHTQQVQQHLVVAKRALEQARLFQDTTVLMQAQRVYGLALSSLGRREEALPIQEAQVRLSEAMGNLWTLSADLHNLAFTYLFLGAVEQSQTSEGRAVEVAEKLGDLWWVVTTVTGKGVIGIQAGDWIEASRDLERAVQLGRQVSDTVLASSPLPHPLFFLGLLALSEGKWGEASRQFEEANARGWEGALYYLAERELAEGRPEVGRALLLPVPDPVPERLGYPFSFLAWAEVELGHEAEAETLVKERLRGMTILDVDAWWFDPRLIEALLRTRQGRWAEAEALLEGALAKYRAESFGYGEAKALYFYGRLHQEQGAPEQARQRWEAALAILNRLSERLYAQQIEQALRLLSEG